LGAEFYPWFDYAYVVIGAGVLAGAMERPLLRQDPLDFAEARRADGEVGRIALEWLHELRRADGEQHDPDVQPRQAAMLVDGTFDTAVFEKGLGANLGVFVPPYSDGHIHGIEQMPE